MDLVVMHAELVLSVKSVRRPVANGPGGSEVERTVVAYNIA